MRPQHDADSIEAQAAEWLAREHFWNWSEAEKSALESWLAETSAHRVAYLRLKSGYARTDRLAALQPAKSEGSRFAWPLLLRVAASFVVIGVLGVAGAFYLAHASRPQEAAYSTPVGGHEIIRLADGSEIELNTSTTVQLRMEAGKRIAKLARGEAFFKITHDDDHPFVVEAAGHRVMDLGTEFSVRDDRNGLEVALVQGKARIESANGAADQRSAVLAPGDVAVATADTMSIRKETASDIANALGWRRGLLVFHNTTLAEAAAALNRYNSNKLVVADAQAAKLTINGTFGTHDVEFFARMAETVFGLHVTAKGTTTTISK